MRRKAPTKAEKSDKGEGAVPLMSYKELRRSRSCGVIPNNEPLQRLKKGKNKMNCINYLFDPRRKTTLKILSYFRSHHEIARTQQQCTVC